MNKHAHIKLDKGLLLLAVSTTITFILFLILRIISVEPGCDFGIDVFYHIKAGDLFPFLSTTKQFPWTEMSSWKLQFYDKELGFHAIIYALRQLSDFAGISLDAPFNFIDAVFVIALILTAAIGSYVYFKPLSFIVPPVLVFAFPLYFEKLNTIRPFLLSMILFMTVIFILMSEKTIIFKCVSMFLFGWLYSICYSVPHVLFIPVASYLAADVIKKRKTRIIPALFLACTWAIGIAVGFFIHPQFPNTYTGWYIQGIEVVRKILGLSGSEVGLGAGLGSPELWMISQNFMLFVILAANTALFACNGNRSRNSVFLLITQIVMTTGFFFSKRCVEYAAPVAVIGLVYILHDYFNQKPDARFTRIFCKLKSLSCAVVIFLLIAVPINANYLVKTYMLPPCYGFAKWAAENLEDGTYVGLLHWGDFPRMFYVADRYKYSMALDPMFSYYIYPERTKNIEKFRLLEKQLTPRELSEALGTNIVYASKFDNNAVMSLLDQGANLIYYDKDGYVLEL